MAIVWCVVYGSTGNNSKAVRCNNAGVDAVGYGDRLGLVCG